MSTNTFDLPQEIEALMREAIDELDSAQRPGYLDELVGLVEKVNLIVSQERERIAALLDPEKRKNYLREKVKSVLETRGKQLKIKAAYERYLALMQTHGRGNPKQLSKLQHEALLAFAGLLEQGLRFKSGGFPGSRLSVSTQQGPNIEGHAANFDRACKITLITDEGDKMYVYPVEVRIIK